MLFKRLFRAAVAAVLTIGAATLIAPGQAHASVANSAILLYNTINGAKCIDDPDSTTKSGTQMIIYDCATKGNQFWEQIPASANKSLLEFENAWSGLCLTVYGKLTANDTPVIQFACPPANNTDTSKYTNEEWEKVDTYYNDSAGREYYTLRPDHALNMCLTVYGGNGTANDTPLIIYTCNGGQNQWWTF